MSWLPFALLAPFIMTLVNFADKYIMERYIPDAGAILIYLALVNLGISIPILWLPGFPDFSTLDMLALILTGVLTITGNIFYFRALTNEDTSTITLLLQLTPVVTLILSVIFLNDIPTTRQLLGFALILLATAGIAWRGQETATMRSPATLPLMLIAALIWSVSVVISDTILDRLVVDVPSLLTATASTGLGYFVGGIGIYLLLPDLRQRFNRHLNQERLRPFPPVIGLELLFFLRQITLFMAISLGPVALVTVVGGTAVFFGIALGVTLTVLLPTVFKENIQPAILRKKALWAVILFIGIALMG